MTDESDGWVPQGRLSPGGDEWLLEEARRWIADGATQPNRALGAITAGSRRAMDVALTTSGAKAALRRVTGRILDDFQPIVPAGMSGTDSAAGAAADPAERIAWMRTADQRAVHIREQTVERLALQGAITGAASVSLPATVVALTTDIVYATLTLLNAAAEILSEYGETADLRERSISTLLLAGEPDIDARRRGLLRLAGIVPGGGGADDAGFEGVLAEQAGPRLVNEIVETIARRSLHRRAVLAVPILGAAAGAVTSAWMADRAGRTAQQVGRLSRLHRTVGLAPSVLDVHAPAGE